MANSYKYITHDSYFNTPHNRQLTELSRIFCYLYIEYF